MAHSRGPRTENIQAKIPNPVMRRLDAAVDRLDLGSRAEALNQAIPFWLDHIEAEYPKVTERETGQGDD
jgi:Arc/MetJ-type ribon-helix-helix transcriptional regulator